MSVPYIHIGRKVRVDWLVRKSDGETAVTGGIAAYMFVMRGGYRIFSPCTFNEMTGAYSGEFDTSKLAEGIYDLVIVGTWGTVAKATDTERGWSAGVESAFCLSNLSDSAPDGATARLTLRVKTDGDIPRPLDEYEKAVFSGYTGTEWEFETNQPEDSRPRAAIFVSPDKPSPHWKKAPYRKTTLPFKVLNEYGDDVTSLFRLYISGGDLGEGESLSRLHDDSALGVITFKERSVHEKGAFLHGRSYAEGLVVLDYIKTDASGNHLPTIVIASRDWVDGSTLTDSENVPGYGTYYVNSWNTTTRRYETHYVAHKGMLWECLVNQPIVSGGTKHYYEPKWDSPYWRMVCGNDRLSLELVSSMGYSFRRGCVNTIVVPYLYYGSADITSDVDAENWNWTRMEQRNMEREGDERYTEADLIWNARHRGQKVLRLTNVDMPSTWTSQNKAIFTCTVVVDDSHERLVVENQVVG